MIQINNYLRFNGNCKEAMEFYQSVFGGELEIQTVGQSPMAAQSPQEAQNKVMHSTLKSGKAYLMASDMFEGAPITGTIISLVVVSDTSTDLREIFTKLSTGGKVTKELKAEFFGTYGELIDRYGINWMFQSDQK